MGSTICMNASCGAKSTHEWKKGWPLRSGGHAILCYTCGSAYEKYVFCDTFHLEESGWRECNMCNKRLHCGCIASKPLIEFLDTGGVGCTSCTKRSTIHLDNVIPNGFDQLKIHNACDLHSSPGEGIMANNSIDGGKLAQLCRLMEAEEASRLSLSDKAETNEKLKQDEVAHSTEEVDRGFLNGLAAVSSKFPKSDNFRSMLDMRDVSQSLAQPPSTTSFGASLGNTSLMPFPIEGKEKSKATSPFNQGQKSRPIFPKPSKSGLPTSDANKAVVPELRIARPPGEGRGKSQLLPRYWPRITDQELQKLSGDLNSNIVPLFEKILSASDAGRIGRLVLPKACAEAYFPAICQSEGIPIKVQDIKGREWTFQFRFWPNNNSRMYVLEGVTPCIQSMQLQAGDTITFSRIDPGGKLVIGFRKATNNSTDAQDDKKSAPPNGTASGEAPFSDNGWNKGENNVGIVNGDVIQQQNGSTEKKRTRTIGLKSKRLLMNSEDAVELRVTWEEAQDLLRPSPSAKPSIVTIEDHEFEEYDEPPVFGKRTLFTSKPFGEREQWAQCDNCSKWRKLPVEALLPPKWTCSENVWDVNRSTCSSPEEISLKDLDSVLKVGKDFKKRRAIENHRVSQEREPSGLDALASAAVLGDEIGDVGEQSVGATTKHPRHRPGCTCIVCIQPPSGKGKHKPTCTCNVCMTVKRRFKTLMLRKKKRQSEREAETSQKENNDLKGEITSLKEELNNEALRLNSLDNKESQSRKQNDQAEISAGQFDLNCHPNREDMQLDISELNMISLADAASIPATDDTKPNGHGRLISEDWPSLRPSLNSESETGGESLRRLSEEAFLASLRWDQEGRGDS